MAEYTPDYIKAVFNLVKRYKDSHGMSWADVAAEMNCSLSAIHSYRKGNCPKDPDRVFRSIASMIESDSPDKYNICHGLQKQTIQKLKAIVNFIETFKRDHADVQSLYLNGYSIADAIGVSNDWVYYRSDRIVIFMKASKIVDDVAFYNDGHSTGFTIRYK